MDSVVESESCASDISSNGITRVIKKLALCLITFAQHTESVQYRDNKLIKYDTQLNVDPEEKIDIVEHNFKHEPIREGFIFNNVLYLKNNILELLTLCQNQNIFINCDALQTKIILYNSLQESPRIFVINQLTESSVYLIEHIRSIITMLKNKNYFENAKFVKKALAKINKQIKLIPNNSNVLENNDFSFQELINKNEFSNSLNYLTQQLTILNKYIHKCNRAFKKFYILNEIAASEDSSNVLSDENVSNKKKDLRMPLQNVEEIFKKPELTKEKKMKKSSALSDETNEKTDHKENKQKRRNSTLSVETNEIENQETIDKESKMIRRNSTLSVETNEIEEQETIDKESKVKRRNSTMSVETNEIEDQETIDKDNKKKKKNSDGTNHEITDKKHKRKRKTSTLSEETNEILDRILTEKENEVRKRNSSLSDETTNIENQKSLSGETNENLDYETIDKGNKRNKKDSTPSDETNESLDHETISNSKKQKKIKKKENVLDNMITSIGKKGRTEKNLPAKEADAISHEILAAVESGDIEIDIENNDLERFAKVLHENQLNENEKFLYIQDLLHHALERDEMSEETKNKLRLLSIQVDWQVPQAHQFVKRLTSGPSLEEQAALEALGVTVQTHFTRDEDECIRTNWDMFSKMYDFDDPSPFINMQKSKKRYLRYEERKKFLQYMGRDLPQKALHSIYRRFRTLFRDSSARLGRFTPEEDDLILTYITKVRRNVNKFAQLSRILKRDRSSLERRSRILQTAREKVSWNIEMKSKFIKLLLNEINSNDVNDLKNISISDNIFLTVANKMDIPATKLKSQWNFGIYTQLFACRPLNTDEIKLELFQKFKKLNLRDWKCIDWPEIAKDYKGFTKHFLWTMMKSLLFNNVPHRHKHNLDVSLKYLNDNGYVEKLQKRVEKGGRHILRLRFNTEGTLEQYI